MTAAERTKVEAILELEDGLTEWEIGFVEDLARRDDDLDGGHDLSERQEETLNRIYEKNCRQLRAISQLGFDDPTIGPTLTRRPRLRIFGKPTHPCHAVKFWTTKDGRKVPLWELTDQHLANIIKMVERTKKTSRQAIKLKASLADEWKYRLEKEVATMTTTWEDSVQKIRKLLAREKITMKHCPDHVGWAPPTLSDILDYGYTTGRVTACGFAIGIMPLLYGRAALCAGVCDSMGHDLEYQYETLDAAIRAMQAVDYQLPEVREPIGWTRAMPGRRYGCLDENGAWYEDPEKTGEPIA